MQVKHYGHGMSTPARIALFMMHCGELSPDSVKQLTSLKRYLFGRVAQDSENYKVFDAVAKGEAVSDQIMTMTFRIIDHIKEVMLPEVKNGTFPKLNVEYCPLEQYADCWQVCLKTKQVQSFICV